MKTYTIDQLAKIIGIGKSRVYQMIEDGNGPTIVPSNFRPFNVTAPHALTWVEGRLRELETAPFHVQARTLEHWRTAVLRLKADAVAAVRVEAAIARRSGTQAGDAGQSPEPQKSQSKNARDIAERTARSRSFAQALRDATPVTPKGERIYQIPGVFMKGPTL
jgi:hypothetical protein